MRDTCAYCHGPKTFTGWHNCPQAVFAKFQIDRIYNNITKRFDVKPRRGEKEHR